LKWTTEEAGFAPPVLSMLLPFGVWNPNVSYMTNGVCVVESKRDSDSIPNIRLKSSDIMKPLVELPIEHYESLLKRASENSPLYFRLKNAIKTEAGTIAVLCDLDEAEMLLQVAKHFCPDAVPQIERAIRLARFPG
jgi:hypothetical protein